MNLGSLLTNLNNNSNDSILGNNKTLFIFAIIVFIIFGFGQGLNGIGQGTQENYGEFAEYGYGNPASSNNPVNHGYPEESNKKKRKHKRSRHDDENEYERENFPPRENRPGMNVPPYGMPFPNMMPPDSAGPQGIPFS